MHEIVIIIAKYFIIFPVLLAFYTWLKLSKDKKIEFLIFGIAAGILALVLAKIGSHMFYNPRPFVVGHFTPYFSHGNDNGFPSDHTLLGSMLAFATLRYNRRNGFVALGVAVVIGLSRIVAGVHHSIDIAGAIVFSAIAVGVVQLAFQWRAKKQSLKP